MDNNSRNNCIIFLIKYPEKGKVKTRLSTGIGKGMVVELYKKFIIDFLTTLKRVDTHIFIFFYPSNSKEKFMRWLGRNYTYIPQKGRDLGERIKYAFLKIFKEGYTKSIVVGSDSPDLPYELIKEAFSSLKTNDVVVGPSFDGGYYLLGFNKDYFFPDVFDGIKWSSDRVYVNTINILRKRKYNIHILSKWRDVDTIDDLKHLFKRNKYTGFRKSKTICYLSRYKDMFK